MISNDAEDLIKIVDGKRTFDGKILTPSTMLWRCTVPGCLAPPKPQRRGQYKDKVMCNACANRKKAKNPEMLEKRGKAISNAIKNAGNKWSEVAKKNMSSKESREKISASVKQYIRDNTEKAIAVRKNTALNNNKITGFGTGEFSKNIWDSMSPEDRHNRTYLAKIQMTDSVRQDHIKLIEKRYPGFEVVKFDIPEYLYKCPEGHTFYMRSGNFIKRGNCPNCVEKSKIEIDLLEWTRTILPNVSHNKRVLFLDDDKNGNKALEIDIFDQATNFGIEVHGLYYHQLEFVGNLHRRKADLADKWGYNLLQFFEDEILYKEDLVKSMIKAKLGKFDRNIYARNCEVIVLDKDRCDEFLSKNHLQGECGSSLRIGLTHNDELLSVLTFRKPRAHNKDVREIARYCTIMNTNVVGGFPKMLKKAEDILKKDNVTKLITYSDRRYSKGNIYKNNGFKFIKYTVPDMFWVKGTERFPREISWNKSREEMSRYYKILGAGHSFWEKILK